MAVYSIYCVRYLTEVCGGGQYFSLMLILPKKPVPKGKVNI